ncbi:MAG: PDZ domain-containing protein [Magnetococcales bacterium]|nr:PDZ domain-containing protein [Magnetococcales bacterium]
MKELPTIVAETQVNKKVTMEVVRAGETRKVDVVIAAMRDDEGEDQEEDGERDGGQGKMEKNLLGVVPQALTPEWRARLDLPAGVDGVVVANVESGSPADHAGIRPGDLLQEINRKPVKGVADMRAVLGKVNPGQTLLVLMRRGNEPLFLAVPLPAKKP